MALVQPVAWRSPKPSMLVRVQHAVLSLPTCCGKGLRSRLVAALVLADPPSLREQSPESLRRLLLLDAWQSGLLHHLAKVAIPRGVRGFDSLSIRAPWLAVKSHFCHWISLWRFGLDDWQPPCFVVSVAWGLSVLLLWWRNGRRGALKMRCPVT